MRIYIILIIIFSQLISLPGQQSVQRDRLVDYNNQNVHGLFVIQRLLELYNQEINKYVDLDSYELNAFGNGDLPKNIFEDPKHEFYKEDQPLKIYRELSKSIYPDLKSSLVNFHSTAEAVNDLRWKVADFMVTGDFNEPASLGKMYEMLESCVALFDDYYRYQTPLLERVINEAKVAAKTKGSFTSTLFDYYLVSRRILHNIRNNEKTKAALELPRLEKLSQTILMASVPFNPSDRNTESKRRIDNNVKKFLTLFNDYIDGKQIPTENSQYGPNYYYHNNKLLNRLNYSGVGVIYEFNELIKNNDVAFPMLMETPHFFKVIYPNRKTKVDILSTEKEKVIELNNAKLVYELPESLANREIIKQQISVPKTKESMVFEFYDHQLLDGDIVSINFNGEWILKNHSLESTPFKLIVKLNSAGKNYMVVHAENEGSKPPNTVAIKYRPIKRKKEVLLSCSLTTSQLIDIVLE